MSLGFNIWKKGLAIRLVLILHFLFFIFHSSFSQVDVPDSNFIYTDLQQALQEPEKVYHLDLSKKKLEEFPMDILKLTNLRTLKLAKNKIKSVPEEIQQLTHLVELDVSNNKLKEFGKGICQLLTLERLILNQNYIESIPSEIKNLKNLVYLDMWDNELWFFPDELSELSSTLKEFDLRNIQYNYTEQARIVSLLPKTKIHMSPACNCKD